MDETTRQSTARAVKAREEIFKGYRDVVDEMSTRLSISPWTVNAVIYGFIASAEGLTKLLADLEDKQQQEAGVAEE